MFERLDYHNWSIDWTALAQSALVVLISVVVAYIAFRIINAVVRNLTRHSATPTDDIVLQRIERPIKWALIAIAITVAAQADPLLASLWEPLASFLRPALLGWIAYALVKAFTAAMEMRLGMAADPVAVRSRRTRVAILSRAATFAIIFITVGLILLRVPGVQDIGTTLLASAGLAALAVGAAAQPALKSLIGGLQMAVTEPLRLGDLVKVDGEAGRVEEIRMSFITVRTWDERVLVVPTTRFLEESFENWSRVNEELTGPVFLHLDPASDIQPIREEFDRFISTHELFDGRKKDLLMTEAYPESIELRLSVSAASIGELFQLRCDVREHMLAWLQREMPDALIRHRLEVESANARVAGI